MAVDAVFELIRKSLLDKCIVVVLDYSRLVESEWDGEFESLMRNRLVVGAYRYGLLGAAGKKKFDRIEYILTKLKRYEDTGNQEALVDVANLCMLEFVEPNRPVVWKPLDSTDDHCAISV